jgi:hypothetical protein
MKPRYILLGLVLGLALAHLAATPPESWKGTVEAAIFRFEVTDVNAAREGSQGAYRMLPERRVYTIYQNSKGMVRRELTFLSRNRWIEGPMDFALFNYKTGYAVFWDKNGSRAERGYFRPRATPSTVGSRRILGRLCTGYEYNWQDTPTNRQERVQWIATDANLPEPLLETWYSFDEPNVLVYVEITVVTELEQVGELPDSMFEPPPGMPVVNIK